MKNLKVRNGLRILMGVLWLIFGANFFFHFLPQPTAMPEPMAKLGAALFESGYFFQFVKLTEIAVGIMLAFNVFPLLALIISAPITINIVLMHGFLDPANIGGGLLMISLNLILGYLYWDEYKPILKIKV